MYCKNDTIRCDRCGKFWGGYDSYTPYGQKGYDPPEPYDPVDLCKKCSDFYKIRFLNNFQDGILYGDWVKSNAEREAAAVCGLTWNPSIHRYERL